MKRLALLAIVVLAVIYTSADKLDNETVAHAHIRAAALANI